MRTKQKQYEDEWLTDSKYNSWLRKYSQDKTKGSCILYMKVVSVTRKEKGGLEEDAKGQKHRVSRDKQTLLTGNISKITVDSESSCAISEKPSDTTNQATNQSSNDLDKQTSS